MNFVADHREESKEVSDYGPQSHFSRTSQVPGYSAFRVESGKR